MTVLGLSVETWSVLGTIVTAVGTTATAIGVWFTKLSLRRSEEQFRTNFEDKLWHEYRSIVQKLPVGVMLGEELTEAEIVEHLGWFYQYFDLTNTQIFLRSKGRIRPETWIEWREGIQDNFRRKSIYNAWARMKPKFVENSTMNELRLLEEKQFAGDPRDWPHL